VPDPSNGLLAAGYSGVALSRAGHGQVVICGRPILEDEVALAIVIEVDGERLVHELLVGRGIHNLRLRGLGQCHQTYTGSARGKRIHLQPLMGGPGKLGRYSGRFHKASFKRNGIIVFVLATVTRFLNLCLLSGHDMPMRIPAVPRLAQCGNLFNSHWRKQVCAISIVCNRWRCSF
jgi:hypothetical protein